MTTTRNQAIKLARQNVSTLSQFGENYKYSTYIPTHHAWCDSIPQEFYTAQFDRSQAMIDIARDAMGLHTMQYDGGAWTQYV